MDADRFLYEALRDKVEYLAGWRTDPQVRAPGPRCDGRSMEFDSRRLGGQAVIAGTRFPVSQLLAEMAEGRSVQDISHDFDLDPEILKLALRDMASVFSLRATNTDKSWHLFQRLWTRAVKQEGYDKGEWKRLEQALLDMGLGPEKVS